MNRLYIYVDGESHYIRNESKARKLQGFTRMSDLYKLPNLGYKLIIHEDSHFFWDTEYLSPYTTIRPIRQVYFTSFNGQDKDYHETNVFIRRCEYFEPVIIREEKDNLQRRQNRLRDSAVIEKPKGADIALATRMIEDAVLDNYDRVGLFTSDSDYLPVIKAVRRMGKYVIVYGFKEYLGNPEFEYIPDEFVDLGYYWTGSYGIKS